MTFLIVLTMFMGVMYAWMGFSIVFFKKFGLINNYFADAKAGKFGEDYARRVGVISLVSGILCLAAGVFAITQGKGLGMAALLLVCVLGSLTALRVNYLRSDRLRG